MAKALLTRIGISLLVLLVVSIIAFALLRLSGDLALEYAGENATVEQIERVRVQLGLDRPLPVQYADWMGALLGGDLGRSIFTQQPVVSMILQGLSVTGLLAVLSLLLALLIGLPLGMLAAHRRGSAVDLLALALIAIGQGVPSFWLALSLAAFFGVQLGWLPVSGSDTWAHFVLPVITLSIAIMPALLRVVRTAMLETLSAGFIETARAKGLSTWRVLSVHALPNASLPIVALVSVQFGQLLAGSVVVEYVFSLEGVGRLALISIERMDFPVVQAIVLCLACIYVTLTLLSDVIGAMIDPRLRRA